MITIYFNGFFFCFFPEIVTTVAVTSPGQNEWAADLERQRNQSDVQSMPDLSGSGLSGKQSTNNLEMFRPSSADLLGNHLSKEPENIMTVPITKGKFYSIKFFFVSNHLTANIFESGPIPTP